MHLQNMPGGGIRNLPVDGPVELRRVAWYDIKAGELHFEGFEVQKTSAVADEGVPDVELRVGDEDTPGGMNAHEPADANAGHLAQDIGPDSDHDSDLGTESGDPFDGLPGIAELRLHDTAQTWLKNCLAESEPSASTRVIEVTDENIIILMMPIHDLRTEKVGLECFRDPVLPNEHLVSKCPFFKIRVQLLEFSDGSHFCCDCANHFCPRNSIVRDTFKCQIRHPAKTGYAYSEVFGIEPPLCTCAEAAMQHIWPTIGRVDGDLDADSFAAYFMEAEPRRMYLAF